MDDYGVIETGFHRKNYHDILEDMKTRAVANFGEEINLDQNSVFGKLLDTTSFVIAELWELAEDVYHSISAETAEEAQLNSVVKYKGIKRMEATYATGTVRITGEQGVVVPAGFMVSREDFITYHTVASYTIGAEGFVEAGVIANVLGIRGNCEAGEITLINTPITGIVSVFNDGPLMTGQDRENDYELRKRYFDTVGGRSTLESIKGALRIADGVRNVYAVENITMDYDENGLPPKSFQCFVYGGEDKTIARTIFDYKPGGIQAFGETILQVTDETGEDHIIGFTYAKEVVIEVRVSLTANAYFPSDGEVQVKDAVIQYIGGVTAQDVDHIGLGIHGTVIWSKLQSMGHAVTGVVDCLVTLRKKQTGSYATSNIYMGINEIPRTSPENIEVILS